MWVKSKVPTAVTLLFFLALRTTGMAQCDDISGTWFAEESVTITFRIPGFPNEVISESGSANIFINQNGCNYSYSRSSQGFTFTRSGTINGNSISLSGTAAILQTGTTCTSNRVTATGTIINPGRIEFTTTVDIRCANQGLSVTGTGSGSVVLTRSVPQPPNFTTHPLNQSVQIGANAIFSCFASENPSYQWQVLAAGSSDWVNIQNSSRFSGATTNQLTVNSAALDQSGDQFRCLATNGQGSATSNPATLTVGGLPPAFNSNPSNLTVTEGGPASFSVSISGNPLPSLQWQHKLSNSSEWNNLMDGAGYSGTTTETLKIGSTRSGMSNSQFRCVATNSAGSITSSTATLTVNSELIVSTPLISPSQGTYHDGVQVILTSDSIDAQIRYTLDGTEPTQASMLYSEPFFVSQSVTVKSKAFKLGVEPSPSESKSYQIVANPGTNLPRITNISTRGFVGTGERLMIAGFVVEGTQNLDVVLRSVGPTIGIRDGITNHLPNPKVSVFSSSAGGFIKIINDLADHRNPNAVIDAFERIGAAPFLDDRDAALTQSLAPGSYALFAEDQSGGEGVGLVEVYDETFQLGGSNNARLSNISTRALVGSGDKTMIAGFWVEGNSQLQVLAQAVGNGIAAEVSNHLPNPQISIFDLAAGQFIAEGSNDDWGTAPNASEIAATATRIGARQLQPGSKDAASLVWLDPGKGYAIFVTDVTGSEGIAVVEVFAVYE